MPGPRWFLAFLFVQASDGILTYLGVARFGGHAEANPLVSWYMVIYGPGVALAAVKAFAVACALPLLWFGMYRTIGLLAAIYLGAAVLPWAYVLWR